MSKETQKENSLASVNPELAKQWHPIKNGELSPLNISGGSAKKVWWKCENDINHYWKTSISQRNNGSGCPYCSGTELLVKRYVNKSIKYRDFYIKF